MDQVKKFIINKRELLNGIDNEDVKANYDYFCKVTDSLDVASGLAKGDKEKEALLLDSAVRFANQLAFILFRYDKLSDEDMKEFRSFPTPEETDKLAREAQEPRKAILAELQAQEADYRKKERDMDIFTSVLAKHMTKEEAEEELKKYEEQLKAQQQMRG